MRIVIALMLILSLAGFAYAGDYRHAKSAPAICCDYDRNFAYGPGVNLVYELPVEKNTLVKKILVPDLITSENKWDNGNKEGSSYLVMTWKFGGKKTE